MIEYEEDWLVTLLFKREGSVAFQAAYYGLFSAILSVLLLVAVEWDSSDRLANLLKEISKSQLWNASTVALLMLLGLRTKTAMSRFWEGTSLLHQMRGEWFDTVSNCVTFSIGAKATDLEKVIRFRHTLVRMMSLCHATALEEIAGSQFKLDSIDTLGLDSKTLKHLIGARTYNFNQVEIMLHLCQCLITAAHDDGILKIPSPILSRVYQTLSRGFVNLLNAKKICDTRFPFPYAQMIAILLFVCTVLTPMQIAAIVDAKSMAFVFTFVPVWGFAALNMIANQLEDPFGTDSNDLPLEHFQMEMNSSLLMLLHPDSDHIPSVREVCTFEFQQLFSAIQADLSQPSRYRGSVLSKLSRRLSAFHPSARLSDAADFDVPDGPDGNEVGKVPSSHSGCGTSCACASRASVCSPHLEVDAPHVKVDHQTSLPAAPEAKTCREAPETCPATLAVPATLVPFAREALLELQQRDVECEIMPSLPACAAEHIAQLTERPFPGEAIAELPEREAIPGLPQRDVCEVIPSLPACPSEHLAQLTERMDSTPDTASSATSPACTAQVTPTTLAPPGAVDRATLMASALPVGCLLHGKDCNLSGIWHDNSADAAFMLHARVSTRTPI